MWHVGLGHEELAREQSDKVWRWLWTAKCDLKDKALYVETDTRYYPNME